MDLELKFLSASQLSFVQICKFYRSYRSAIAVALFCTFDCRRIFQLMKVKKYHSSARVKTQEYF